MSSDLIHPQMTVLDVVSTYRQTEQVFDKYNDPAGECICCKALFETLQDVASKYDLDLQTLLVDLETAARESS
jgi:hypothetical protein